MARWSWWLGAAGCVLLAGCSGGDGPPVVEAGGKVVENGQPVAISPYREGYNCLQVDFYPVDDAGKPVAAPHYAAFVAEDGSFQLGGEAGKGVPSGKYRVAVRRVDRTKTVQPDPAGNIDAWEGKFGETNSPFIVQLPPQGDLVIDLAKAPAAS